MRYLYAFGEYGAGVLLRYPRASLLVLSLAFLAMMAVAVRRLREVR